MVFCSGFERMRDYGIITKMQTGMVMDISATAAFWRRLYFLPSKFYVKVRLLR